MRSPDGEAAVSIRRRYDGDRTAGSPAPATALKAAREHAEAIHALLAKTSVNVVQIGLHLQAVRNAVGRRHFGAWLKAEFRWTRAVASNYMQVARVFAALDCLDRFQPSALFVLARKKCPPGAQGRGRPKGSAREAGNEGPCHRAGRKRHFARQVRAEAADQARRSLLKVLPKLSPGQLKELAAEILEMAQRRESDRKEGELTCRQLPSGT